MISYPARELRMGPRLHQTDLPSQSLNVLPTQSSALSSAPISTTQKWTSWEISTGIKLPLSFFGVLTSE